MTRSRCLPLIVLAMLAVPAGARASDATGTSYQPAVPISAFARPSQWLDLSRMQVSAEFMVGGGAAGRGYDGLQVTRLQYQVADPLHVRVSIGNQFGGTSPNGNRMFLEGLDLTYRPFNSVLVQFHYQDVRSPLQYNRNDPFGYGYWR